MKDKQPSAMFMLGSPRGSPVDHPSDTSYRPEQNKSGTPESLRSHEAQDAKAVLRCSRRTAEHGSPSTRPSKRIQNSASSIDQHTVLLSKALSEFAKDHPRDFIDPVAYAHRSIEQRRLKSTQEGRISRPLNSYMLYRKAYQQVARRVIQKDQQQSASQIVGISWSGLEHEEVKSVFRKLAETDHKMHHIAFPSYKYTPTQGKTPRNPPGSTAARRDITRRLKSRNINTQVADEMSLHFHMNNLDSSPQQIFENESWRGGYEPFLPNTKDSQEDFEIHSTPDLGCPPNLQSETSERQPFASMADHYGQFATGLVDGLGLDHCIDPSLFSHLGDVASQAPSQYWDWLPQDLSLEKDSQYFMPDIVLHRSPDPTHQEGGL